MNVNVAQLNIGTMIAPTDDPAVAEFMDNLDRINAQADEAPGFVWRLQTDEGNATSIQIFPDPLQLVNMSVWESIESLKDYVYRTDHVDFFRRRAMWFEADAKRVALWWVPAGTTPELDDAMRRVEFLERHGSSPYAFGFAKPPPPLIIEPTTSDDPRARDLVERLDADLSELGAGHNDDLSVMRLAIYDGLVVGCGTARKADDTSSQLTWLLIDPAVSDLKIDAALVDQLGAAAMRLAVSP